ncbi:hypothetical protein [Cumulibacter soli]|uniref:hypothetical protein n=1 Tax=Cumulibacter soli TaxID=2546344 RepID=UPI0010679DC0|nr:hypothetical protein [Cumulibacter soli]
MTKYNVRRFAAVGLLGAGAVLLSACGGAPSESELKDKFMEQASSASGLGMDEATYEQLVDCLVPKLMDNVSDDGLEALMDADADTLVSGGTEVSQEDKDAFEDATATCSQELTDQMMEDAGAGGETASTESE